MKQFFSLALAALCVGSVSAQTVTETYDFAGFTAKGAPTLTLTEKSVEQSGTNAKTVYLLDNPTANTGEVLNLKNRIALDNGATAGVTMRWMWRTDASNAYKNGLAGNWNGKGSEVTSYNLSVLNVQKGDTIVFTYAMQAGKPAELHACSAGVISDADGVAVAAEGIVESGKKYVAQANGNLDIYCTNNNMAIQSLSIITTPKILVTESYDFAAFTAGGAPALTVSDKSVAQAGSNANTVYEIANPTNNAGELLNLKGRFAIDNHSTAATTMRWMWRSDASNAYKNGLAGNWNGKGSEVTSYNLSVLKLVEGDTITFTYAMQAGKPAELHACAAGVIAADGAEVAADGIVASGTKYVVLKDGNLDLYCTNNNMAIQNISIVTSPKIQVVEKFDFAAFTAGGAPTLAITDKGVAQAGSNANTVYVIANPTNSAGELLNLKNRFAIDNDAKAATQMRWMWRSDAGNAYKNGLAGNWNGNGAPVASYNLSVLSLQKGDSVTITYAMQAGKPAELHACAAGVVAADGVEVAADGIVASGTKYVVLKDGNLDLYCTNNNMAIQTIEISYTTSVFPAPEIVAEGDESGAVLITLKADASDLYYKIGGEPIKYTKPFYLTSSALVTAWSETSGMASLEAEQFFKAGVVAAPTVNVTKVDGNSRTVAIASATAPAKLIVNGKEGDNNQSLTIDATTEYVVVAKTETVTADSTYVFYSDTTTVTIEAGVPVKLAAPVFTKGKYDEETGMTPLTVSGSQASVLCAPKATVVFTDASGKEVELEEETTFTLAEGTVKAYAKAAGYENSETVTFDVVKPLILTAVWENNIQELINNSAIEDGTNFGSIIPAEASFSAAGVDLAPVYYYTDCMLDSRFGVQVGTSWLSRKNINGYLGLYQSNSGGRIIGIKDLKAGMYIKVAMSDHSQMPISTPNVIKLNEAQTTTDTLVYDVIADGVAAWNLTRYMVLWHIGVYADPSTVYCPDYAVSGYKGVMPKVSFSSITEGADIYYSVALADSVYEKNAAGEDSLVLNFPEYSLFQKYEGEIELTGVSKIKYYAEKDGVKSHIDESDVIELAPSVTSPLITWTSTAEDGVKSFTLTNTLNAALAIKMYYKLPGQADYAAYDAEAGISVPAGTVGWMTAYSEAEGLDPSPVVSRYLDKRESYKEAYVAFTEATTQILAAISGDVEYDALRANVENYPDAAVAIEGKQFFHIAVHANYNNLVLPFAFALDGSNIVTDAVGNVLKYGEDYKIINLTTGGNGVLTTSTNMDLLINENLLKEGKLDHPAERQLNANANYLLTVKEELVGQELIFISSEGAQLQIAQSTYAAQTTEKWSIVANRRLQTYVLQAPAYVLNPEGTAFELQGAGHEIAPFTSVIFAGPEFMAANRFIVLDSTSGIESLYECWPKSWKTYDMMGREVEDAQKSGLYIQNGKKIMVK